MATDPELRDLKVEFVELPGAMNGIQHLRIAQTHGDGTVTELYLTEEQARKVASYIAFSHIYVKD